MATVACVPPRADRVPLYRAKTGVMFYHWAFGFAVRVVSAQLCVSPSALSEAVQSVVGILHRAALDIARGKKRKTHQKEDDA